MEEQPLQKKRKTNKSDLSLRRMELARLPNAYKQYCEVVCHHLNEAFDKEKSLLSKADWKPKVEDWHRIRWASYVYYLYSMCNLFGVLVIINIDPFFSFIFLTWYIPETILHSCRYKLVPCSLESQSRNLPPHLLPVFLCSKPFHFLLVKEQSFLLVVQFGPWIGCPGHLHSPNT